MDPEDGGSSTDKTNKIRNQQERQTRVLQLSREATALLERTRLHVRVQCQAIHAKNARHMLIDLIDYFQPTLVLVGSRGLGKLKGTILGSMSHYLIQKSSAPVMVSKVVDGVVAHTLTAPCTSGHAASLEAGAQAAKAHFGPAEGAPCRRTCECDDRHGITHRHAAADRKCC